MALNKDLKFETIKKIAETSFKVKNLKRKGGQISDLDSTSPPSVFIGSGLKYPNVNVGILSPLQRDEDAWIYDAEKYWAQNNFSIQNVMGLRQGLLNSRFKTNVKAAKDSGQSLSGKGNKKFLDIAKQIALSSRPVDMEIHLNNRVNTDNKRDRILKPSGFRGSLKQARLTSNVKIPRKIDKVVNDELKSTDAMELLYKSKVNEYALNKIFSIGVLGLKKQKKFVPTRWSITATDDTLGKHLLKKIRDYRWIENYEIFYGEFLGNQYLVMLIPNAWSYELFELYYPGSSWNPSDAMKAATDLEWFSGRTTYAQQTSGGYYAARLPILEYLDRIQRQASVLVIRLETPSYWAGLGVWVVRESVRKALSNESCPKKFSNRKEFIESCKKISSIKYDFDAETIFKRSQLLKHTREQKNLNKWF